MKIVYDEYGKWSDIPVKSKLKNKKIVKYFSLETAATIVGVSKIREIEEFDLSTPFYFAYCKMDLGEIALETRRVLSGDNELALLGGYHALFKFDLNDKDPENALKKMQKSYTENKLFSPQKFSQTFFLQLSPIDQFKILANMPVSFVSIAFDMHGDNVTLYESSSALLLEAVTSDYDGPYLLGAAKAKSDGSVRAGFALIDNDLLQKSEYLKNDVSAVDMIKNWHLKGFH